MPASSFLPPRAASLSKALALLALAALLAPGARAGGLVTDHDVAAGCRTDIPDVTGDGTVEMHTHADSITYSVKRLGDDRDGPIEVRGFVTGVGFRPELQDDDGTRPLVHFQYDMPFVATFFARSTLLVEFNHGHVPVKYVPGPVEPEWLSHTFLRNAMLRRGQGYLALNLTGRDGNGDFTAHLLDGSNAAVSPHPSSPLVANATCAIRNLLEKLRGRAFRQTIYVGHSLGAYIAQELAGGRSLEGYRIGWALDPHGKPIYDGLIGAEPYGDIGLWDPERPIISKLFLLDGTGDIFYYLNATFDFLFLRDRLASPASKVTPRDIGSWVRLYQIVSPHVFPESFFDSQVWDPTAPPNPTYGAEEGGHILALVDALSEWAAGGREPPPSHLPGSPTLQRGDLDGDGVVNSSDADVLFQQDGGAAFPPSATILVNFTNVAEDTLFEPFDPPFITIYDIFPPDLAQAWFTLQADLGAVTEELVPPAFALRRGLFEFYPGDAEMIEPLTPGRLREVYGDRYGQRLASYVRDLAAARLWAADEPVFVLDGLSFLDHEVGTPYDDPGVFAASPRDGVIHPRVESHVDVRKVGVYDVTYRWRDHEAHRGVNVVDTAAPRILGVRARPGALAPADGTLRAVSVTVDARDLGDPHPVSRIVAVSSSDPAPAPGAPPDFVITGALGVQLRAAHVGRVYTIQVECADASGNRATGSVEVRVAAHAAREDGDDH